MALDNNRSKREYDKFKDVSGETAVRVSVVEDVGGGGSGTEYTEGATDASITGVAAMAEGPSDTLTPIQVDASKNLKVAIQGTPTVSVSGVATESTLAAQSSFDHGSKSSVGTSAVQITTTSIVAKKGVTVKAANANTGIIYVGNSDVTNGSTDATDGFELANGESIFIEIDNANKVYVIGSAASQKVFWVVV